MEGIRDVHTTHWHRGHVLHGTVWSVGVQDARRRADTAPDIPAVNCRRGNVHPVGTVRSAGVQDACRHADTATGYTRQHRHGNVHPVALIGVDDALLAHALH